MNICITIISILATIFILFIAYLLIEKKEYNKLTVNNMLNNIAITFSVFVTSFSTLIICKMLSIITTEPMQTIIGSGIHIPILMILFSLTIKKAYKIFYKEDLRIEIGVLTISYIISCIFIIIMSFTYLKDWSMGLLFTTILLGKFIWFDGASFGLTKKDIILFFSLRYHSFIIIFCIVFICILCFAERYGSVIILSIFVGMDFGMALTGLIIVLLEKRKEKIR